MLAVLVFASAGCFRMRPTRGGGDVDVDDVSGPRRIRISDVAVQYGYSLHVAGTGLTFPTGITFDDAGTPYVIESGYSYGEKVTEARLLELDPAGKHRVVARSKNGPWTGVYFHQGSFYIAEGGAVTGAGKILKVGRDGAITTLVDNLPSMGDHHTNGPVVAPDGTLYFGQGTVTNSGVVGEDSADFGWLSRHPEAHDIPCKDIKINATAFESKDVLKNGSDKVKTSAYSAFGTTVAEGAVIPGAVPCSGAVLKVPVGGGPVELVAWGYRNPFGLAFDPAGQLYVTDNSYDERGSRPVWGSPDMLFKVVPGSWAGWPDYSGGLPVAQKRYKRPGYPEPTTILTEPPMKPIEPSARFGSHSSSDAFDFSRNEAFGFVGEAFVPQFGDMAPTAGKVTSPVGFRLVRVDPKDGVVTDFATNKGPKNGPASKLELGGLERPVAARFDPSGTALYVVDFGVMAVGDKGPEAIEGTGMVWKITRGEP